MRTNVYVDGFNLYYGCLDQSPYKWLDLNALCLRLLKQTEIQRIRYFTAKLSARPTDPQQPQRQATYIRALHTLPNISVHYGEFKDRKKNLRLVNPPRIGKKRAFVHVPEEKGSDVNLASYLLMDGFTKDCDIAVVLSNDSDLKTPVQIARSPAIGIKVGIFNPHSFEKRSLDLQGDFFRQIKPAHLKVSQFPETLTDEKGRFLSHLPGEMPQKCQDPPKAGLGPSRRSAWGDMTQG